MSSRVQMVSVRDWEPAQQSHILHTLGAKPSEHLPAWSTFRALGPQASVGRCRNGNNASGGGPCHRPLQTLRIGPKVLDPSLAWTVIPSQRVRNRSKSFGTPEVPSMCSWGMDLTRRNHIRSLASLSTSTCAQIGLNPQCPKTATRRHNSVEGNHLL